MGQTKIIVSHLLKEIKASLKGQISWSSGRCPHCDVILTSEEMQEFACPVCKKPLQEKSADSEPEKTCN